MVAGSENGAVSDWPFDPPIETMEARTTERWPAGPYAYEPKWDGFRAVAWGGGEVRLDSRNRKPLLRYFPELEPALRRLPAGTVVDGEVVVVVDDVTSFERLQSRIHPAASRIAALAAEIPASLVAFDLLAVGGTDLRARPFTERRAALEDVAAGLQAPWYLTPTTTDLAVATAWFDDYEPAGCDGIVAKRLDQGYESGRRAMVKIKHRRTVDCVVGGYRIHRDGDKVGSILLGLYDPAGDLHFVGHCSGFSDHDRTGILRRLEAIRTDASFGGGDGVRVPGADSRWSQGTDPSWTPVIPGVVVEVSYDQLEGNRFRHATRFHRWRPDKDPADCTLDQLARPAGVGFGDVVGSPRGG